MTLSHWKSFIHKYAYAIILEKQIDPSGTAKKLDKMTV